MNAKVLSLLVLLNFILLITVSCAEEPYDVEKEGKALSYIKRSYQSGLYEKTIELARQFKARHPYAHSNIDIDLAIADSYFNLNDYLEASIYYGRFAKLYPKHPKRPYALYKIGLAHWEQAPTAIDREQSFTKNAIKEWKRLVHAHPESTYAAKAKKLLEKGEHRVLESEQFIASFYCKQGLWPACAYRSLEIIADYPDKLSYKKEALLLAAKAFKKLAYMKRDANSDDNIFFKNYSPKELEEKAHIFLKEAATLKN